MAPKLQMTTSTRFGFSNKAQLNPPLLAALAASGPGCPMCGVIEKDVLATPDGGEYVEAASFPGRTVRKLDAHFRTHWKEEYEFIDRCQRKGPQGGSGAAGVP